jgi:hypothetical protein
MVHPVLRRVWSQGEIRDIYPVHAVVQLEEDTDTGFGEKSMRRFGKNVKAGDTFRFCDAIGGQVFLDREM